MEITDKHLENFEYICLEIERGVSVRKALKGLMSSNSFYEIMNSNEENKLRYAHAKDMCIEAKFDSISEDYESDPERDAESGKIDPAWVNLQRLKIDSKKWELAKLKPKKYGDKVDVNANLSGSLDVNLKDLVKFE